MAEPRRVVLATTNPHKVEEFRAIYADLPVTLVTPADLGLHVSVEETGTTFERNAILKAIAFAEAAGLPALADDSGLEIDALGGEPGVYSARWAGEATTYPERFRILFRRLAAVSDDQRTARYRCAIALAEPRPRGLYQVVEGTLEGAGVRLQRAFGFGNTRDYDPFLLFIALFVWMGASEEASMVQLRTSLGGIPVQRVMLTAPSRAAARPCRASPP